MAKKHVTYYLISLLLVAFLVCCSTKKNTAATRAYHYTTARWNINFNARTNYDKGIEQQQKAMEDDYSKLLPMYPISVHENGQAASSSMTTVIEKCRKTIKLHSITKKPAKKNPRKAKNPEYQQWLKQNEFNPQVKRAWILLGQAEFQKADFIGAVGTFSYIIRHYSNEPAIVTEARIWLARAYTEMDWKYEAEEVLDKINENDVPRELDGLYASARADLLLKENKTKEATPFLEIALDKEKTRYQRVRFNYILGQLALLQNDKKAAHNYFKQVVRKAPNYTVEFNARMQMLTSDVENSEKSLKALSKMAKNPNNADYLDQIYYAEGNIYLNNGDEAQAIEAYKKAVEASTRNGIDKATVLIKLGDIHYKNSNYIDAAPCFEEAATIINTQHDDYERVTKLAETLGELSLNYNTVVLQDSLQALAQLSEQEQRTVVAKIIEQVIAEEEEARRKAEAEEAMAAASDNMDMSMPMVSNSTGEWYFYNSQLINTGKNQFQQRWGKRKLEDNWRRINKSVMVVEQDIAEETEEGSDSIKAVVDDTKNPDFYLKQIPNTPEQIEQSNKEIADALLAMADIYTNKLEDNEAAEEVLLDYEQRFPQGERLLDCYYTEYHVYGVQGDTEKQDVARQKIIDKFPDSKQATILSQPDYAERVAHMYAMQDSLYAETYKAYTENRFAEVKTNYQYIVDNYPLSTLMPKFAFLRAMAIGKTESTDNMQTALNDLVEQFPQSDVSSRAKDILALMSQGKEAQQGTAGSIASLRQEELDNEIEEQITEKTYSAERKTPFALVLQPADDESINQLVFDIAAYNFSKFLIKDFDLNVKFINERKMLVVSGFEDFKEASWYKNLAQTDEKLQNIFDTTLTQLLISEENLALLQLLGYNEYVEFSKQNALN